MEPKRKRILLVLFLLLVFCSDLCFGNEFCASPVHQHSHGHHHHDHHHDCAHGHNHLHHHGHDPGVIESKLPEELAEEEDMKLYGFGNHDHDHHRGLELSGLGIFSFCCLVKCASVVAVSQLRKCNQRKINLNIDLFFSVQYKARMFLTSLSLSPGLWIHALGCSLLVSLASLICLIILPVIFSE